MDGFRRLLEEDATCGPTKADSKLLGVLLPAFVFFAIFIIIFVSMRNKYPKIYQPNAGDLVEKIDSLLTLIMVVWSSDEVLEKCGCDAYLFLETIKGCFKSCMFTIPLATITMIVYATGGEFNYEDCGLLPILSSSNVPSGINDSHKLWAPFCQMVFVVSVSLYVLRNLYKELSIVADKNHSKENAACCSVLIYNIQIDQDSFKETMREMYGDQIVELRFIPNTSKLHSPYTTWLAAKANVDAIEKDGEKDATCYCIGGTGTKEDAEKALDEAQEKFLEIDLNELEMCPVAIVTFKTARAALECSQVALMPGGRDMMTRMCPFKDDLYYENLHHTETEKTSFRMIGLAIYIAMILLFSPLMAAVQGLADLDSLAEDSKFVRDLTELDPAITAIIQGLIPVIIFSVFFALLPIILWHIVGIARPQCKNDQEGAVLPKYADCLIGMGLLVSVCASLITQPDAFTDLTKFAETLSNALPGQAVFYMGYILNAAFFGLAMELSGVVALILSFILGGDQPEMIYYTAYPSVIMMFCLTLTYSVLAPITLIWGMVYFGLSYWIWKYQLLYVYKPKHESYTWKFFPSVFSRLHSGIFIMQLILIGLFTASEAVPQACLTIFTLVATVVSLNAATNDYGYYFDRPSLQTTVDFDKSLTEKKTETKEDDALDEVDIKSRWTEDQLFTPPSVLAVNGLKQPSQKSPDAKMEVVAHDIAGDFDKTNSVEMDDVKKAADEKRSDEELNASE